jgi:hypothetical protein
MKMKQIFFAALTARIISLICLAVFFFTMYAELEIRTSMQALGLSFTAWLVGSFFVGIYKDNITRMAVAKMTDSDDVEEQPGDDEKDEYPSHPIFEEDDNE